MIAEIIRFNDTKPFHMQKLFYQACTNLKQIEMDQENTILDIFEALGFWPLLKGQKWNGTHFDWIEITKQTRLLGLKFDWFLNFSVVPDNFTGRNILRVRRFASGRRPHIFLYFLQIDVPENLKPLSSYEIEWRDELLKEVAIFLGASKEYAKYETYTTIKFENELGNVSCFF